MIELSIMSAEIKRKEDNEYQIIKKIEEQIYNSQSNERIENLVKIIFTKAKSGIEKDHYGSHHLLITKDDIASVNYTNSEFDEAILLVKKLLEVAGYRCDDFDEYSKSWQTRSGKIGYLIIRW